MKHHPALSVTLDFDDRVLDIAREGYDLATRITRDPGDSLKARQLAVSRRIVCASPGYIERHGRPQRIEDLPHHRCIGYANLQSRQLWRFEAIRADGESRSLLVPSTVSLNNGAMRDAAIADLGITVLPLFIAATITSVCLAVAALKERIAAADGLLIATTEHNNSIPGVVKNTIDWLSRPPAAIPRVFGNRPVAIMGASPGGFGTVLSQNVWLPVLRTLRMRPWFGGRLLVSRAGNACDGAGELTDDQVREQLRQFVEGFSVFARGGRIPESSSNGQIPAPNWSCSGASRQSTRKLPHFWRPSTDGRSHALRASVLLPEYRKFCMLWLCPVTIVSRLDSEVVRSTISAPSPCQLGGRPDTSSTRCRTGARRTTGERCVPDHLRGERRRCGVRAALLPEEDAEDQQGGH